ncbi:MAG: hypothetical protein VKP63_01710 [Cyanobacteriota bacterium]|nr:hypothetical protein [Cyanobacteriota bacterium]
MPCWTSPWPVAAPLEAHLRAAGLKRCHDRLEALPEGSLLLYVPPDAVLAAGLASASEPPAPQQLAAMYRHLQALDGRHRLIAAWRLQAMTPKAIRAWLDRGAPLPAKPSFPEPDPVSALLTKTLLDSQPQLQEAYLDVELIADLAGGEPDTAYSRRLAQAIADSRALLARCWLPYQRNHALLEDVAAQLAREDALAIENQQAREEEARWRVEVEQLREAHDRLGQTQRIREARLGQLEDTVAAQATRVLELEADLQREKRERDEAERRTREAERRTREAEVEQAARREVLEQEKRAAVAEADERLLRLHQLLEDHERLFLDDQGHRARIVALEETIAAREEALRLSRDDLERQGTRVARLEADEALVRGERDQARQQREEILRQATSTEADLRARVQAMEVKTGQASQENRRLTTQLHQLQEEMEELFLQGQAGEDLIAAQHQQLQRAQSLMSRLLVQSTQPLIPSEAVSVEVLPPHSPKAIHGFTASAEPSRQGPAGRVLRRFWSS